MRAVPTLSYSSSRTYLECPLRWKFLYVDRLGEAPRGYFTFGRTIHSVLERLLGPLVVPVNRWVTSTDNQRTLDHYGPAGASGSDRLPMSREALLSTYDSLWSSEGYTSPEEEARYRSLGAEMLLGYYGQLESEPPQPVAVEEHLETTWDGIPIHGYIDRLDRTPSGGLEIVDYKTSRELSREDVRDSDQLSIYQVLVERNYPDPVDGLTFYHLRSLTPIRAAPRPKTALETLYDRLGQVSDGIRSEAFDPTPGRQCRRCEFQSLCPEFRSVPTDEREELKALVDRFAQLRADEQRLSGELERTAGELHAAAERAGVHRIPGSDQVAIRRREESWVYPPERIGPMLVRAKVADVPRPDSPEAVRRLLRNPAIDPELRRRIADAGTRRVRWYWELEDEKRDS